MININKKKLLKTILFLSFLLVIIFVSISIYYKYSSKNENVTVSSVLTNKLTFEIKLSQFSIIDTSKSEYSDLMYANNCNTVEAYNDFLTKYPNGKFSNLILSKMILLESEFSVRKVDSIFVNSEDDLVPFSGYKSDFLYFTDNRDEQTYRIIKIGKKFWFAENLRYKPDNGGFWAYNNNDSLVNKYGYLYDWQTANAVCPKGWHLSTDEDWNMLEEYCGGRTNAGITLKSKSGWYKYNSGGKNNLGFSAIAAGYKNEKGDFQNIRKTGGWWTSDDNNKTSALHRNLSYENNVIYRNKVNKSSGYSVRCVK